MRLFVGFSPSPAESRALYELREQVPAASELPLRWVPVENWHVTLLFLGDIAAHLVAVLSELLAPVASRYGPASLLLDQLIWFPDTAKARLLALVGEADPVLRELQQTLSSELGSNGFSLQQRRWRPHITLARYRGPRKRFTPFALPTVVPINVQVQSLCLYQSVSGGRGSPPRYTPLQQFELAP